MSYITASPEDTHRFDSPVNGAPPVYLNRRNDRFLLLKEPSVAEINSLIEEHSMIRLTTGWEYLLQEVPARKVDQPRIRFFHLYGKKPCNVSREAILKQLGIDHFASFGSTIAGMTLEEQRAVVATAQPRTRSEMLKLCEGSREDMTGFVFFATHAQQCTGGSQFFEGLINPLFSSLLKRGFKKGPLPVHRIRARVLELLTMARTKGWLLFPHLNFDSTSDLVRVLLGSNFRAYFCPPYIPSELKPILSQLDALDSQGQLGRRTSTCFGHLALSSTCNSIEQLSTELLQHLLETIPSFVDEGLVQKKYTPTTSAKKAYNALIRIRNSAMSSFPPLQPIAAKREAKTLEDYVGFAEFRAAHPALVEWADAFKQWISASVDTQHTARRTLCRHMVEWLVQLPNPPASPLLIKRSHINDTTSNGKTFRNFLTTVSISAQVRNNKLVLLKDFFAYVSDRARAGRDVGWMPNPVDMRFDRFADAIQGQGSIRKAIGSHIMATMRSILVEHDYAWSKKMTPWGYLLDRSTNTLEYVWCPSQAILLYTLLSVPIRGAQVRMLDSGEGDAEIYDFDRGVMIPNPRQLPVDGRLDPKRREGLIQLLPSGIMDGGDILSLWITTNKTSGRGYSIPWISEELLEHLRYQREWILRYADSPNMHSMADGQGHRGTPRELRGAPERWYVLFRDLFAERAPDLSLPVMKQKTAKLWGQLCWETQKRINANASSGERIVLVEPGTETDFSPRPLHDIHSLRVSGITDLLDRGVPLNIVSEYVAGHATYVMTLWYDKPSPGAVRRALIEAQQSASNAGAAIPALTQTDIFEQAPFLVSHYQYEGLYNGFDALEENKGLAIVRASGICPGTRCSEGALDEQKRAAPVPVGDRGPSCPQCRFWLTGPAFLLGQTIEGNQLILKIRAKTETLKTLRESIMDAEDSAQPGRVHVLQGQQDLEERQLNDMLTEWWHRMRFFEASRKKLAEYEAYRLSKVPSQPQTLAERLPLDAPLPAADWAFRRSSELELKHFLSTCAELLPDSTLDATHAKQDIELAVAKFLSINDKSDLAALYLTLDDSERLTAANLTVEMLLQAASDPEHATRILAGEVKLTALPDLRDGVSYLFADGLKARVKPSARKSRKVLKDET